MLTASAQQISPLAFSVAVHRDRDQVVVGPTGELDMVTAPQVELRLADLRDAGFADVVLDLRALTFMDSSGLELLLSERRTARAKGHRFRLMGGSAASRRVLELTGTAGMFDVVGRS